MRNKNLLFLLAGVVAGGLIVYALTLFTNEDNVLATVGDKKITEKQLMDELETIGGKQFLQNMIDVEVITESAKENNLTASQEELDKELENYKLQFSSEEEYQAYLGEQGTTEDELKEQLRTNVLFIKLTQKDVNVTEADIEAFYKENEELFVENEQVSARHILVETEQEAKDIIEQLNAGKDFAALAKEKSLDETSAEGGGDLGFFGRGEMDPAFEEAAFTLEVGKISEPVKSDFGYHIIEVQEKKEEKKLTLEEAKADIEQTLKEQSAKTADELLPELRENVGVKIHDSRYKDVLQ